MKRYWKVIVAVGVVLFLIGVMLILFRGSRRQAGTARQRMKIALAQGKPEQALGDCLGLLKESPEDYELLVIAAQCYQQTQEYGQAGEYVSKAAKVAPPDKIDHEIVRITMALERVEKAFKVVDSTRDFKDIPSLLEQLARMRQVADRMKEKHQDSAILLEFVGRCMEMSGRVYQLKAVLHEQYAKRLKATNRDAAANREDQLAGEARSRAAYFQSKASEAYRKVIKLEPSRAFAVRQLAGIYFAKNDMEKAYGVLTAYKGKAIRVITLRENVALALAMRKNESKRKEDLETLRKSLAALTAEHPTNREARIVYARLLQSMGKRREARKQIDAVLKRQPNDPTALYMNALLYLADSEYAKAKDVLQVLQSRYPKWIDVQYQLAVVQVKLGSASLAQALLRGVLRKQPEHGPARYLMVRLFWNAGRLNQAAAEAQAGFENRPKDTVLIQLLIDVLASQKKTDQAEEILDKLAAKYVEDPEIQEVLAKCYSRIGKQGKASSFMQRIIRSDPDSFAARLVQVQLARRKKDYPRSAKLLDSMEKRWPKRFEIPLQRGISLAQRGRPLDAQKQFERALEISPDNLNVLLNMARNSLRMGLGDETFELCDRILRLDPHNRDVLTIKASLEFQRGNVEGASKLHQQASQAVKGSAQGQVMAAMLALRKREFRKAIAVAREGLRDKPGSLQLNLILAKAYEGLGDPNSAVSALITASIHNPDNVRLCDAIVALIYRTKADIINFAGLRDLEKENPVAASYVKGQLLRRAGKIQEAFKAFKKVDKDLTSIKRDTRLGMTVQTRVALADLAMRLGRDAEALQFLQRLVEEEPSRLAGLMGKYTYYFQKKDKEKAAQQLDLVLKTLDEKGQANFPLRTQLLNGYLRLQDISRSEKLVLDTVHRFKHDPRAYLLKIGFYRTIRQNDKLLASCRQALERHPGSVKLFEVVEEVYLSMNLFGKVRQCLDQLSRLGRTGQIAAHIRRAFFYNRIGLFQDSIAECETVQKLISEEDYRIAFILGSAYASMEESDKALEALRRIPLSASQFLNSRLLMARIYMDRGEEGSALRLLRRLGGAVKKDPRISDAIFRVLMKQKAYTAAQRVSLDYADRFRRQPRLYTTWLLREANAARLAGNWDVALRAYQRLVTATPKNVAWQAERLAVLAAQKKWKRSTGVLSKLSASMKKQSGIAVWSLLTALHVDDNKAAKAALEVLAGQATGIPRVGFLIQLEGLLGLGDYAAAEALVQTKRRGLGLPGKDARRFIDWFRKKGPAGRPVLLGLLRAHAFQAFNWLKSADTELKTIQKLAPDLHLTLVFRYRVKQALGEEDAARKLANKYIASNVKGPSWLSLRVAGLMKDKNYRAVRKVLGQLTNDPATAGQAWMTIANTYEAEKDTAQAIEAYRKCLKASPNNAVAANNLAYLLIQGGAKDPKALDEALQLAKQAVSLVPGQASFQDTLGWVYFLRGEHVAALRQLQNACVKLARRPEVHLHLGVAYMKSGSYDLARRHLLNVELLSKGKMTPDVEDARKALDKLDLLLRTSRKKAA